MIGTLAVSDTFGPRTAPAPTRTPSVRMHREPTNAPSSTITGRAPAGSSTPPIPTPPARCTSAPICAPALFLSRNKRHPPVALALGPEERSRRDDQPALEQPRRELLRPLVTGHVQPEVHRRDATRDANPVRSENRQEDVALTSVDLARPVHVRLVVPRDDRRALHEFLGRGTDGSAELLQRGDQIAIRRGEGRSVAGHRPAFA